jgi:hypothetical protein
MNSIKLTALACTITALSCLTIALLLFFSIRNERMLYENRMVSLVDSVTTHLDACAAKDAEVVKKYNKQNWKVKK